MADLVRLTSLVRILLVIIISGNVEQHVPPTEHLRITVLIVDFFRIFSAVDLGDVVVLVVIEDFTAIPINLYDAPADSPNVGIDVRLAVLHVLDFLASI